jgi:hypothetical protein
MMSDRITVAVGGDGRHLFDSIRDSRVRLVGLTDDAQPDLLVFPCSRFRRFDNVRSATIPQRLREHIGRRDVGLVFDSSLEGVPHKQDVSLALHQVIDQLGAISGQCVYVTQDRQFDADYRAHCSSIGVAPVTVMSHDYWVWDALKEYQSDGAAAYQQRMSAFRNRGPLRRRKFLSMNRTPRPIKILFLLRLMRDGLWNDGFISFGGFRSKTAGPGKGRPSAEELEKALPAFADLIADVAPWLDRLDAVGRLLLGLEQHGWKNIDLTHASAAVDLAEYNESWFTVVTETEMRSRPSRITEKVIKPLVNFHPVLVLGNPQALKMIREYGFVTFDDLFDESYDDVWDPRERFEQVYRQVVQAARWSDDEWQRNEKRIEQKLLFNAHWGLTQLPGDVRSRHDRRLVDRVLETTRFASG